MQKVNPGKAFVIGTYSENVVISYKRVENQKARRGIRVRVSSDEMNG